MNAPYAEFAAEDYPIKVEAFDTNGTVVWSVTAEGPGVMQVPELRSTYGPVGIQISGARGVLSRQEPPA